MDPTFSPIPLLVWLVAHSQKVSRAKFMHLINMLFIISCRNIPLNVPLMSRHVHILNGLRQNQTIYIKYIVLNADKAIFSYIITVISPMF